jgi:hypothetical protein
MLEGATWIEAPSNMDIELECMTILEQNEEPQGNSGPTAEIMLATPCHLIRLGLPILSRMGCMYG